MKTASFPLARVLPVLLAVAVLAPLRAQTPVPTVIPAPNGGTIVTATPTPGRTPEPVVIKPLNGGTIITATPTPGATAAPAVLNLPNGGAITTTTPTPGPQSVLDAASAAHLRRLVRDVKENTDNIKSKGVFGAQLWLITDSDFFLNWRKPETPQIAPIEIAVRNQPIYTAIIFYGAARDEKGLSNVSYDITVRRPDKSVYAESKDLVGFQNLGVADERQLLLGRNYLAINIGQTDPTGVYTVETTVHDNIGRADLPLVQHFIVQPQ